MPSDRDKLLRIMNSLEHDYRSGRISPEKYSYFRSKYEDKLNSIDAKEATQRIRSMQGKSNQTTQINRRKSSNKNKKEEEQDLVQKYIINPKIVSQKMETKNKIMDDDVTINEIYYNETENWNQNRKWKIEENFCKMLVYIL